MRKYLGIIAILAITFSSCSNEMSLQKYFATKSSKEGFLSINVPSSILELKDGENSSENIEALKSFKRLNILILKNDDSTSVDQKKEIASIEKILENGKFKELMSMNYKGQAGVLSYSGDDNNIKEVIGFGYSDKGFLLARLTGDKMTVKQLAKLASSIDFDKSNLDQLQNMNWN